MNAPVNGPLPLQNTFDETWPNTVSCHLLFGGPVMEGLMSNDGITPTSWHHGDFFVCVRLCYVRVLFFPQ